MKKIRFVNPIKECLNIQGKRYTVGLIATIVGAIALSIIALACDMLLECAISAIISISSIIYFGWCFGVEPLPEEEVEF